MNSRSEMQAGQLNTWVLLLHSHAVVMCRMWFSSVFVSWKSHLVATMCCSKTIIHGQASRIFTDFNVTHAMGTNVPLCTDKKLWGDRSTFKIRLKTLLFHKAYRVRSGSGEAEPSLSCASVGSGCWGSLSNFSFHSWYIYTPLLYVIAFCLLFYMVCFVLISLYSPFSSLTFQPVTTCFCQKFILPIVTKCLLITNTTELNKSEFSASFPFDVVTTIVKNNFSFWFSEPDFGIIYVPHL